MVEDKIDKFSDKYRQYDGEDTKLRRRSREKYGTVVGNYKQSWKGSHTIV